MAATNDIMNELREISPLLHDLKEHLCKPAVPPRYFEGFTENFMAEIMEPQFNALQGTGSPDKPIVPDAYFDQLADQVMRKIRQQEETIGKGRLQSGKTSIQVLYLRRLAVAAMVTGAVVLGILILEQKVTPVNDCGDGIACLTREEIRQYVEEHADEFDAVQIHEAFQPDLDAEVLASPAAKENKDAAPAISEKQIEKYIEDNPAVIDFEDPAMDIF